MVKKYLVQFIEADLPTNHNLIGPRLFKQIKPKESCVRNNLLTPYYNYKIKRKTKFSFFVKMY